MKNLSFGQSITDRSSLGMCKYLQEIAKYSLISPEKEVELAKRIQKGDKKAENELVTANLRYVVSVAKQYRNNGLALEDLISAGNIGLIIAARRFDEKRGFKFISYATWWIRQSIMNSLNDNSRTVRIPANVINLKNKIHKAAHDFEQKYSYTPSSEDLAEELGTTSFVIDNTLNNPTSTISIDAAFDDDNSNTLGDIISNDEDIKTIENMQSNSLKCLVNQMLNLPEIDSESRSIVKMIYGISCPVMSIREIAEEMSIPEQRVYQIKYKALGKMKDWAENGNIASEYLS